MSSMSFSDESITGTSTRVVQPTPSFVRYATTTPGMHNMSSVFSAGVSTALFVTPSRTYVEGRF